MQINVLVNEMKVGTRTICNWWRKRAANKKENIEAFLSPEQRAWTEHNIDIDRSTHTSLTHNHLHTQIAYTTHTHTRISSFRNNNKIVLLVYIAFDSAPSQSLFLQHAETILMIFFYPRIIKKFI